jgi:hypothetical protein
MQVKAVSVSLRMQSTARTLRCNRIEDRRHDKADGVKVKDCGVPSSYLNFVFSNQNMRRNILLLLQLIWIYRKVSHLNKAGSVRMNVTMRGDCISIVTVEKKQVLHILCVCVRAWVRARACVCVCVCVCPLVIQHAKRMPRIAICGLSDFTKFFHIIS